MNCLKCGAELHIMADCIDCGAPNPYMDNSLRDMVRRLSYSATFIINGQPSLLAFDMNHDICVLCDGLHGVQSFPLHLLKEVDEKLDGHMFNPSVRLLEHYSKSAALGCQAIVDDSTSYSCGRIMKKSDVIFVLQDNSERCFSLLSWPIFITPENDFGFTKAKMRVAELLTKVMDDISSICFEYARQLEDN